MNCKRKVLSVILLTLALTLGVNVAVLPTRAQEGPKIFVYPENNLFSTETTVVGDTFTVSVNTTGWVAPGPYGYEFKVFYDPTLLTIVDAEYPDGHFFADVSSFEVDPIIEANYVTFASIITEDLPEGVTGSGVFSQVIFEIIAEPPLTNPVSCDLTINDVDVLDYDGNSLFPEIVDGYYEFAPPEIPKPYLKVLPESVSAEEVGDEVVVNITVQELAADFRAVGFEWKLYFNTSILEYVNATEGDFLAGIAAAAGPEYGTYFYAVKDPGYDYIVSFSLYYKMPAPPEIFPEGSGTLATIEFQASYKPTVLDMVASCILDLEDVLIVNDEGNAIETDPHEDGEYFISIAAPPYLSITPKTYTATVLNEEFDLTVFVNELEADWKMVGAEFKIRYNLTMLDIVNITEAGFMKHFAMLSGTSEPYTWFQFYVDQDTTSGYGIVGVLILPLDNGTWLGPFPDTTSYGAPGDLATVTFKAIDQHPDVDLTSDVYLDEITLANTAGSKIPYDADTTAVEGLCKYTILASVPPFAGFLDLMTQYAYPWNGLGRNAASDAFPPQGVVHLLGNVTYRGDVVPFKPVSYAITTPTGETFYATTFTEDDGIADFEYSLPGSEANFGLWTVKASVDLAGTVMSDTLYFLVGWLVEVAEIEAPAIAYKDETMDTNVTLTRICMQDPRDIMNMLLVDSKGEPITDNDLLLYITVTDELKQPVATQLLNTSMITESGFSQEELKAFVMNVGEHWTDHIAIIRAQYPELVSVVMNGIGISPAAFSGEAAIHVNLLTDFPGVAYCREGLETVWIQKRK